MKNNLKKFMIGGGIMALAVSGSLLFDGASATGYELLIWTRPTDDAGWAQDVKQEQLNLKFSYQLDEMKTSLTASLEEMNEQLLRVESYPDSIKWELNQNLKDMGFSGQTLMDEINKQYAERLYATKWEIEKINQSLERVDKEIDLRRRGVVDRKNDLLSARVSTPEERREQDKLRQR